MKLNYNQEDKTISIDDGFKTQYWLINILAIFNIVNAVLYSFIILEEKHFRSFGFIWIILGIFSLIGLIYQFTKRSAAGKLQVSEIKALKEKQFIGRKSLRIQLHNGKSRDLTNFTGQKNFVATKELFSRIGVAIK